MVTIATKSTQMSTSRKLCEVNFHFFIVKANDYKETINFFCKCIIIFTSYNIMLYCQLLVCNIIVIKGKMCFLQHYKKII